MTILRTKRYSFDTSLYVTNCTHSTDIRAAEKHYEELMKRTSLFLAVIMPLFAAYSMEKKPLGLENIGNSCFINATLQSLFSMEKLTNMLLEWEAMYKPGSFALSYVTLAKEQRQKTKIDPQNLQIFCILGWNLLGYEIKSQQDAGELLQIALEHLSYTDIKDDILKSLPLDVNKQPITELSELYSIKTSSIVKIPSMNYQGEKSLASSVTLTLPLLPSDKSLNQSLARFFAPEAVPYVLKGQEAQDAQKATYIEELGQYIIIHLKRTSYSPFYELIKNQNPISFPLKGLTFNAYSINPFTNQGLYDLKAFILHSGEKGGVGHYTGYVRYGLQWYRCNDSSITPVTASTVETIGRLGYSDEFTVLPSTFVYELRSNSHST